MNISLPPVRAFRKFSGHENAWASHYGAMHVIAGYCGLGLPDDCAVKGLWQHGVFGPWDEHTPGILTYNAPGGEQRVAWVAREEQAVLLRAHGYAHARAVGMPILYTRENDVRRQPRSLLVMPCHTLGGWTPADRTPYERYADEVAAMARDFDQIAVCISPRDRKSGLWVREFEGRGYRIIDGAQTTDANALIRMRMLFEQFETLTTNGWGSHVAYALAYGAKVSICGTLPTIDAKTVLQLDAAWRANPTALAKARSDETEKRRKDFLNEFYVPANAAAGNRALGEWLIGASHQLSPAAMRELLPSLIEFPAAKTKSPAPPAATHCGDLPVVLVRSHEYNYSETFVEDHVNHLTRNLTLLYGFPFPRFLKGGRSVLPEALESRLRSALAAGKGVPAELWREYTAGLSLFLKSCGAKSALVETGLMGAFVHEACEQAGLPYVVHFHGVDAFGQELLAAWSGHYRKFFKTAAGVVAVSQAMREQLLQLGADETRTVLAPYGVAVDLPAVADPAKAPPHFVAVGRFVEKKAPQLTLQAFAAVHRVLPQATLVMIGDGPLLAGCRQWVQEHGLAPAVTFAGVCSREEVSRQLAAARAFVQHSVTASNGDSEGLPLAVLEAGAHGLPVVSTLHAGIPDAVRPDVDGFLVPERDVEGMTAAMLRLAQDPGLAATLGASFRTRVVENYSREGSLTRLLGILLAAAESRPAQPKDAADQDAQPRNPRRAIAEDRDDQAAYIELGATLMDQDKFAGAYIAIAEGHRLSGGTPETAAALQQLESLGITADAEVEKYRRRAGWVASARSAQPKRILIVTNLLPPQEMGGYGRTVWEFARELLARGHEVRVLTADMPHLLRKPGPEHAALEPNVARVLRLYGDWKDGVVVVEPDMAQRQAIARENHRLIMHAIADFRADVIMAGNLDFVGHFFIQPALDRGIPVLHRLGNAMPGYEPAQSPRGPLFCLAGCSEWVNRGLRAKNFPISRYEVVPPGSPLTDYFRAWTPQRERLRIAYAGLLMPYKGAHVLVAALAHLKRAGIEFECTLAGDTTRPEYLESLRAIAKQYGFADQLNFPGFLGKRELAALFARSNVLVFPSVFEEPFGKTQIEAMAAGLLVVSSGSGGASEIVEDGKTGLLFKGGDPRDLAEKLFSAHRNPRATEQIALAGQARAFEFTTEASVDRLERLFDELVATARGADTPLTVQSAETTAGSSASIA